MTITAWSSFLKQYVTPITFSLPLSSKQEKGAVRRNSFKGVCTSVRMFGLFVERKKCINTGRDNIWDKEQKWSKPGAIKWIRDTGLFLWHHNTHPATARHWSSAAMRVGWLVGMRCFNANISVLPSCICASPRYTELNVPDAEINHKINCADQSRDVSIELMHQPWRKVLF